MNIHRHLRQYKGNDIGYTYYSTSVTTRSRVFLPNFYVPHVDAVFGRLDGVARRVGHLAPEESIEMAYFRKCTPHK